MGLFGSKKEAGEALKNEEERNQQLKSLSDRIKALEASVSKIRQSVQEQNENFSSAHKYMSTGMDSLETTLAEIKETVVELGKTSPEIQYKMTLDASERAKKAESSAMDSAGSALKAKSACEEAKKSYDDAVKERAEAVKASVAVNDLRSTVEATRTAVDAGLKSLETGFKDKSDVLLKKLEEDGMKAYAKSGAEFINQLKKGVAEVKGMVRQAYFLAMPAEQKTFLIDFGAKFNYNAEWFRTYSKDLREDLKRRSKDLNEVQKASMEGKRLKLYNDDRILDVLVQCAEADKMDVADFYRSAVEVLRARDADFKQRYDSAEKYEAGERAKSKKR